MIKSKAKLPDKLSELILVALEDLAKVKANPKYSIDLGMWHKPGAETCQVCLAGCVIAGRMAPNKTGMNLTPESFTESNNMKLDTLDLIRCGWIDSALTRMKQPHPKDMTKAPRINAVSGNDLDDKKVYAQFKRELKAASKWLAARGL